MSAVEELTMLLETANGLIDRTQHCERRMMKLMRYVVYLTRRRRELLEGEEQAGR